jgi:type III pantothenate kinase
MLLTIDIGNSAIKFGVFETERLTNKFSIPTQRNYTADEIADRVGGRIPASIDAAIACSVVPEVESAVADFVKDRFGLETRFVCSTDALGLEISFEVATTGTDRLVNASAAVERYGVPCIVVSLGTATTIDVVDRGREYLGGLIAPGMSVSAEALSLAASKLPEVETRKPNSVISKTTDSAIRSGIVYGQVAMVEGLLERIFDELGERPHIVATGGFAEFIASETVLIDHVDTDLTMEGLRSIFAASFASERSA